MGISRNRDRIDHGIKPQPGLETAENDKRIANQIVTQMVLSDQENVRQQLDILRKTRAKRGLGEPLIIPPGLREDPAKQVEDI